MTITTTTRPSETVPTVADVPAGISVVDTPTVEHHGRRTALVVGAAALCLVVVAAGALSLTSWGRASQPLPSDERTALVHGGAGTLRAADGTTLAAPSTLSASDALASDVRSAHGAASTIRLHRSGYVVTIPAAPTSAVDVEAAHGGAGTVVDRSGRAVR